MAAGLRQLGCRCPTQQHPREWPMQRPKAILPELEAVMCTAVTVTKVQTDDCLPSIPAPQALKMAPELVDAGKLATD